MTNDLLNCLHESKMLLRCAEDGDWDAFIERHPVWTIQVNQLLENPSPDMEASLAELLEDVDKIRALIQRRMVEIEAAVSSGRQQQKAVKQYLR
ncbi:flagellar protein FliT [Thiomicrospira sp. S5]|uniref:flagellar protein FliT n=1 Tax=Thiomicrospira sp. S5 TaxID=1803865 RepID=UPI000F8A1630|nr:flagellar protein FliT [Thiomicrospira sp. S5]AZR81904.1 hypothetical protein AYJ59_06180 [Thiomicrospira sp. S5]